MERDARVRGLRIRLWFGLWFGLRDGIGHATAILAAVTRVARRALVGCPIAVVVHAVAGLCGTWLDAGVVGRAVEVVERAVAVGVGSAVVRRAALSLLTGVFVVRQAEGVRRRGRRCAIGGVTEDGRVGIGDVDAGPQRRAVFIDGTFHKSPNALGIRVFAGGTAAGTIEWNAIGVVFWIVRIINPSVIIITPGGEIPMFDDFRIATVEIWLHVPIVGHILETGGQIINWAVGDFGSIEVDRNAAVIGLHAPGDLRVTKTTRSRNNRRSDAAAGGAKHGPGRFDINYRLKKDAGHTRGDLCPGIG